MARLTLRSRSILLTAFLITSLASFSQEKDAWQVYPAYKFPVQCIQAGNSLYVVATRGSLDTSVSPARMVAEGNLFSYDMDDESVRTFNCYNDLNGQHISKYSYNEETGKLLLIYDDGNMDVMDPSDYSCININALVGQGISVNSIYNIGKKTFLCANTGILEVNTEDAVVKNYFRMSSAVNGLCFCNGYYYAATDASLSRIKEGESMSDISAWESVIPYKAFGIASLDNMVYTLCNNSAGAKRLQILNTTAAKLTPTVTGWGFSDIVAGPDIVVFQASALLAFYKKGDPKLYYYQNKHSWLDLEISNSINMWVVDSESRICRYALVDSTKTLEPQDTIDFSIDSPSRDAFYSMQYDDQNRLLVAGGVPPYAVFYIPETAMILDEDGRWIHFDEESQKVQYSYLNHRNLVSLVEDPDDPTHFYTAVSRNGLEEYRMNDEGVPMFVNMYNVDNSPLKVIKENEGKPHATAVNYCSCYGLTYDKNGNLWMAQEMVDTIVRILRPDGQWVSLFYPDIQLADHPKEYLFPKNGPKFLINQKDTNKGFFGFDTNGTINYVDDDKYLLRSTITNQRETIYTPDAFNCMTETNDGEIWCGTSAGLFVITDAENWFDEKNFRFHQIIKNRDDGSGLADYVLDGVNVTAIAVDGANRKWIGTESAGLYLLSDNGQETIYHFTKDDSPLLSNKIQSIAINPKSGLVMIGTDVGLCSYMEGVSKSAESLDVDNIVIYPNPVTPESSNVVNITNLTDGAEVKILSSSGQVVWGGQSTGGSLKWDCIDMRGHHVDSGVYHVMINTKDAGKTVTKRLVVVR